MWKTSLEVEGMMCGQCEAHVNHAVRQAFPAGAVKKVTSSHAKGRTEVLSEQPLDEGKLRAAIDATGYTVRTLKTEPYEKRSFSLFHRS